MREVYFLAFRPSGYAAGGNRNGEQMRADERTFYYVESGCDRPTWEAAVLDGSADGGPGRPNWRQQPKPSKGERLGGWRTFSILWLFSLGLMRAFFCNRYQVFHSRIRARPETRGGTPEVTSLCSGFEGYVIEKVMQKRG